MKWASAGCKKRGQRGFRAEVVPIVAPDDVSRPSVTEATRADLVAVAQQDSARGVAALALAERLDANRDTGAGLASLNREWRATLDAALQVARPVSSVGRMRDELAARRGA